MQRDPLGAFRRTVAAMADEAVHAALGLHVETGPLLTDAPKGMGDFALPCFPFAKAAKKAPPTIAALVAGAIAPEPTIHVAEAGPYVNFTVVPAALAASTLRAVEALGAAYGSHERRGERVLVEHTSANPTGPLHVGRARNPILGDTIARVLRAAGHDVITEYYVNDMGRQAAMVVWGVSKFGRTGHSKPDHAAVESYQRAAAELEGNPPGEREILDLVAGFERGDAAVADRFRETIGLVVGGIRSSLERLHVHHDNFKFESELVLGGEVGGVLERLKGLPACGVEEGALFLDMAALGSKMGKEKFFLTRKDGTTLYGTRDIAYHMDKAARTDRLVDVLGEDHKLALDHLGLALKAAGSTTPLECVFYNFVSLPEGKMSTRKGRVVYLDDLMDEAEARAYEEVKTRRGSELSEAEMRKVAGLVGIGALRFNIVSVQAEKQIVFKWEDALAFDGSSAPFVQYAHARACSILEKARGDGHAPWRGDLSALSHPAELELLRLIGRLPGLVVHCGSTLKVHPLTAYAVELATALNMFYRDCPVLKAEPALRDDRLSLVDAARQALANTLALLGIEAPDSM